MKIKSYKKRLLVFAGKPGVGKSTIINTLRGGWVYIDVWHFMVPLIESGEVPTEDKNILAYQAAYTYIDALSCPRVIFEIGTNFPELNSEQLSALSADYEIDVLLCHLPIGAHRERLAGRGFRTEGEGIERRLARDFPALYIKHLEKVPVRYHLLNTSGSVADVSAQIRRQFIER